MTVASFLRALAEKTPTPGGGAVCGVVGSLASSLAAMVVGYSVGRKALEAHQPELAEALRTLGRAANLFMRLADEDAAAYQAVRDLSRLDESDPARAGLDEAKAACLQVPMATLAACGDVLLLLKELAGISNRHLRSDLAIAAVLAEAAARSSWWNVSVNASTGSVPQDQDALAQAGRLRERCIELAREVERACGELQGGA